MKHKEEPFGFQDEDDAVLDIDLVGSFYLEKTGDFPPARDAKLMLYEELAELEEALDLDDDPEHILKEMCDVYYTILGYSLGRSWDFHEAFMRVHASNMSKEPTASGKVRKGENYSAPDLSWCV